MYSTQLRGTNLARYHVCVKKLLTYKHSVNHMSTQPVYKGIIVKLV